jgi:hypothetical protein
LFQLNELQPEFDRDLSMATVVCGLAVGGDEIPDVLVSDALVPGRPRTVKLDLGTNVGQSRAALETKAEPPAPKVPPPLLALLLVLAATAAGTQF